MSFSPLAWAEQVAAIALAQAGRFDECRQRTARALRLAREHALLENLAWALGTTSIAAYFARGASGAPVPDLLRASAEALEIVGAVGSRYSQIAASNNLALASLSSGEYAACEERLTDCLASAREWGTGLDWHGQMLAVLADARLARGNGDGAIAAAREGIAVADAGGAWFQAALARAALVDALVHTGAPDHAVAPLIAEARELVRKSGGNSLLPRLREAEARLAGRKDRTVLNSGLREAEAMYRAMGAPDPAERLSQETDA
jgi:tetratricopeptide (TPR) repeat protein